jgi:hypothetical protein
MPGSLSPLSVVCKEGRLWLPSGEYVDADRGGDFCMAGRMLFGSAWDGPMANLARVGDIGVESSSRFLSSVDWTVSVLIGGGGGGTIGGGLILNPDLAEEGGLGFANAAEGSGSCSLWMTPFVLGASCKSSFFPSDRWSCVASTISRSSSPTTAKAALAVERASDGVCWTPFSVLCTTTMSSSSSSSSSSSGCESECRTVWPASCAMSGRFGSR